jgi:hypothetical protein
MKRAAVQWGIGRYLYNWKGSQWFQQRARRFIRQIKRGWRLLESACSTGMGIAIRNTNRADQQPHDGHQHETRHLSPWMRTKSSPNSLHTLLKTIAIGLSIAMKTHGNCLTDLLSTRANAKTLLAFDSKNLNRRRKWLAKA